MASVVELSLVNTVVVLITRVVVAIGVVVVVVFITYCSQLSPVNICLHKQIYES